MLSLLCKKNNKRIKIETHCSFELNAKERAVIIDDLARFLSYIFFNIKNWECKLFYKDKIYEINRFTLPYHIPRLSYPPSSPIRRLCLIFGKKNISSLIRFSKMIGSKYDFSFLYKFYENLKNDY